MGDERRREAVADAVYRALGKYEQARRLAHDLRMIHRGAGPRIKRGTGRGALTVYLTDAVIAALDELEAERRVSPEDARRSAARTELAAASDRRQG